MVKPVEKMNRRHFRNEPQIQRTKLALVACDALRCVHTPSATKPQKFFSQSFVEFNFGKLSIAFTNWEIYLPFEINRF